MYSLSRLALTHPDCIWNPKREPKRWCGVFSDDSYDELIEDQENLIDRVVKMVDIFRSHYVAQVCGVGRAAVANIAKTGRLGTAENTRRIKANIHKLEEMKDDYYKSVDYLNDVIKKINNQVITKLTGLSKKMLYDLSIKSVVFTAYNVERFREARIALTDFMAHIKELQEIPTDKELLKIGYFESIKRFKNGDKVHYSVLKKILEYYNSPWYDII